MDGGRRRERQAYRQVGRSRYTRGLFVCSRKVLICEVHGVYTRVCVYELQRVSSSEACTGTANCANQRSRGGNEELDSEGRGAGGMETETWRTVRANV